MARRTSIVEVLSSLWGAFRFLAEEPRYLVYALLVHAGFLLMFVMSFEWTSKPFVSQPEVNVVQATVVDEAAVQREVDKLREAEARRQAEEEARLRRQREETQRAEQQRRQAEEVRKREEQRAAEARRQEQQARREAEEARRQAEEARKREEQRAAEQRRQEEARRAEEQRRQEEAARLAEEQRRRDEQAAAERARREQSEVERYVEVIRQQVERNWNKPANWTAGTRCTVRVNLIPGGDVVDVRVVRSCGDPLFDSSVERAVYRASPLRVPPPDSGLFDRFRELEFVFNPQG
jgi:colicin import membrane protein